MGWHKIRSLEEPREPAIDVEQMRELIRAEVRAAIAELPEAKQGPEGERGLPGRDGESIHPDTIRLMVLTEVQNAVATMPQPRDGRDAYDLDILQGIDDNRIYARGTFASHKGGLMQWTGSSWRVIVRGVAEQSIEIDKDDPRRYIVRTVLTDGETQERSIRIPLPLYKGVYHAQTEYELSDKVTYDGSEWICVVERTAASPAKSEDWQLTVKRGKDGKDGKEGPPGRQGPPGQDLRYK